MVKHRLDNYLVTVTNYDSLLVQACQYLAWRDEVTRPGSNGVTRRDSLLSLPSNWTHRPSLGSAPGISLLTYTRPQGAQIWITQFNLQTTPCLRSHSPDGAATDCGDNIQLQLTTYVSTPKG